MQTVLKGIKKQKNRSGTANLKKTATSSTSFLTKIQ